jgi:hypothetical protein
MPGKHNDHNFYLFLEKNEKNGAEGLACADPGARTPIGVSGIFPLYLGVFPPSLIFPFSFKMIVTSLDKHVLIYLSLSMSFSLPLLLV